MIESVAAVEGVEQLDADALRALGELGDALGWTEEHLDHLASAIAIESRWDPKAQNPSTRATGLIQWMPSTAKNHGTTVEAIREMSAAEQLRLAQKYFEPFRGIAPRDVGVAILMPSGNVGASDDKVIAEAGTQAYELNAGLDVGQDGAITVGDVRSVYGGPLFRARARPRIPIPARPRVWLWLLGAAVVAGGAYLAWTRATDREWDEPIRALLNGRRRPIEIYENPSRRAWKLVQRTCGPERKRRRLLAREWADRPCKEGRAELREQAGQEREEREARAARATPKQRKAQRHRRRQQLEHVEREAADLERHLEQHTSLPGPAIAEAVREFKADPWEYFRRSKKVGGRTHPYEFAAEAAEENASELIDAAERRALREVRRAERERADEPPF